MEKRAFIKNSLLLGIGVSPALQIFAKEFKKVEKDPPQKLAGNESFWEKIRKEYDLNPDYINLENGYYCIMPTKIEEAYQKEVQRINKLGSFYMRKSYNSDYTRMREKLAGLANCSLDEIVITRNTTESLDLVIGGIDWEKGDEAVMCDQDYGSMLDMFRLQAERHGIVNKVVTMINNPKTDQEIVDLYANAITSKTKLLMVCQMINITGQILPVSKICAMAKAKDVEVMVDGAHAFAHIGTDIKALGCDYYGTSLHKWLTAPMGSGMLYVKKGKAKKLWPLFAEVPKEKDDILRLNHTGTKPVHIDLGIAFAIEFYETIGAERKEERLRFLQNYWVNKVKDLPGIVLNTPEDKSRSCAIANVGVKGMKPNNLAKELLDKYKVWTVAINHPNVKGCRITPNVFTSVDELDRFIRALKEITSS